MKKEKQDNYLRYATMISGKLVEMFKEDSESDYKISMKELQEENNLTEFFHALANVVPCSFYDKMTGDNVNTLDFNHIANKLCFQFSKLVDDESDTEKLEK